jgi:hypothetical protein
MWWRRIRYLLILAALCAIATCPTAKRSCTTKNDAREATDLLDFLADKVAASARATGKVPPIAAGPTPTPSCCDQGGTCSAAPTTFAAAGWVQLGFTIDGDYHYSYQYIPAPNGGSAVIRAVGDLDCNGVSSLYEVELTLEPGAGGASVTRHWTRKARYE